MVLLFQTGYLTIDKAVDAQMPYSNRIIRKYYLHFPNQEVEESFNECVLDYYVAMKKGSAQQFQEELVTAVGDGNVDKFMDIRNLCLPTFRTRFISKANRIIRRCSM